MLALKAFCLWLLTIVVVPLNPDTRSRLVTDELAEVNNIGHAGAGESKGDNFTVRIRTHSYLAAFHGSFSSNECHGGNECSHLNEPQHESKPCPTGRDGSETDGYSDDKQKRDSKNVHRVLT